MGDPPLPDGVDLELLDVLAFRAGFLRGLGADDPVRLEVPEVILQASILARGQRGVGADDPDRCDGS